MSLTKTFMLAQAFEELVQRIYEANGYTTLRQARQGRDQGFDLLLKAPDGKTAVVEIKVGRTRIIPRVEVVRMLEQLDRARELVKADNSLLVIAASIGIPIKHVGGSEIVDLQRLEVLAAIDSRLAAELDSIARELAPMPIGDADQAAFRIFGDAHVGFVPGKLAAQEANKGKQLIAALKRVASGRKGARAFEERCLDALRYIFENDFTNWSKQKVSDGGISRYDVIARISSEHDFWKSIVVYFRSWYVVFEFKNYTNKISQGQIYTTEKYLFPGAMRTVALIISRKGADKNALAVTRGAVRESGKLIIQLSLDDIFRMLEMKDNSDDPNSILFDYLDDMLMKLER